MCAHSLLTIGEVLRCNYGNQRWVKITLHFLQCWYIPQSQFGDMRQMMERRREGRGEEGREEGKEGNILEICPNKHATEQHIIKKEITVFAKLIASIRAGGI